MVGDKTEMWAKLIFWAKIEPKSPKIGQNAYLASR